jgi:hypothetical protein
VAWSLKVNLRWLVVSFWGVEGRLVSDTAIEAAENPGEFMNRCSFTIVLQVEEVNRALMVRCGCGFCGVVVVMARTSFDRLALAMIEALPETMKIYG